METDLFETYVAIKLSAIQIGLRVRRGTKLNKNDVVPEVGTRPTGSGSDQTETKICVGRVGSL